MPAQDLRAKVLEELSWNGHRTVTELAEALGVAPARMRAVVAKLWEEDLIESDDGALQVSNKG